jgi:hypothetical protein
MEMAYCTPIYAVFRQLWILYEIGLKFASFSFHAVDNALDIAGTTLGISRAVRTFRGPSDRGNHSG